MKTKESRRRTKPEVPRNEKKERNTSETWARKNRATGKKINLLQGGRRHKGEEPEGLRENRGHR